MLRYSHNKRKHVKKHAYHLVMTMFLGFPYIVEEPAAHLFGVPHGHKHSASVTKYKKSYLMP